MDSAMRDLEQIREKDVTEGRPLALVGLLLGVTLTLVFGVGSLVGWTDEAAIAEDDPLARLDGSSGLVPTEPLANDGEATEVVRTELAFPHSLGPESERPEVAAALAAASAELAHPDPIDHAVALERALPAALPASVAAGTGSSHLAHAAARDPLLRASIPSETATTPAPAGREGEYTVQVISYDSPEGAEEFASGLRQRGHRAFVVQADVEGRGTMYRVRVGPFENLRDARAYRASFEQTERMNTLVVRRRETT